LAYATLITISALIFFISYLNRNSIAKNLGLYDIPDNKLKLHYKKTPKIGGIILISASLTTIAISIFYGDFFLIYILLLTYTCSFFGLLDDIYNINANKKFISLTVIFTFFLLFFPNLLIQHIQFNNVFFDKTINFENKIYLSFFLTILCYQLLINAFNMSDGHNGISAFMAFCIILYILIFKIPKIYSFFFIPILVCLILFLIYNIKSKIFLGDSGNYFLSILFGSLIIQSNNIYKNFSIEEIFILLMLPGIDMLKVFYIRLKNKKNPLIGDRNHFHHLLVKKFSKNNTTIIYYLFFIVPIIIFSLKIINSIYIIFAFVVIFFYMPLIIKKNK